MSQTPTHKYIVKVKDFEFSFSQEDIDAADLLQKSNSALHLLYKNHSVNGVVVSADTGAKQQQIEIEGEVFDIQIKDQLDQVLDQLGFNTATARQVKEIKAPMPGLVLEVSVTEGQSVVQGEKLLILVAMKMENAILIQSDATIKRVAVKAGEAVEKGQVMIELE